MDLRNAPGADTMPNASMSCSKKVVTIEYRVYYTRGTVQAVKQTITSMKDVHREYNETRGSIAFDREETLSRGGRDGRCSS